MVPTKWGDLAPHTGELRGCPCRSIGFNGHNPTSTDDTVTLIIGCASNSARVPRHNVLRRSTVNGPTPARHLGGSAFLVCHDIKCTPPPAAGRRHSFRIYNYLQSVASNPKNRHSRYTAETVSSERCLTIRECQTRRSARIRRPAGRASCLAGREERKTLWERRTRFPVASGTPWPAG